MKVKANPHPKIEAFLGEILPRLVGLLRRELQEYGQMLVLLQHQQEHVMARAADQVLHSVAAINEQMGVIQQVRSQREALQQQIASTVQAETAAEATEAQAQVDAATFDQLLPHFPARFRIPIAALVRENNQMLQRIQHRARQNHLLLSRSLEIMHQLIQSFMPASAPTTYDQQGQIKGGAPGPVALYQSVG